MSADRPDLSIVVVSYNGREALARCLAASRAAIDGLAAELIVVDNASVDGSPALVAGRFPEARLIANRDNVGFGRANNQAFAVARGRYILLLNPDTEPAPDALRNLVTFADANPRAGLVGAWLEYPDGRHQHSAFRFPDWKQALFGFFDNVVPLDSRLNGRYPPCRYARPFAAEHLLGACLLVRREALEQVGMFDPRYFMYFEETDLCARMRRAGWLNLYTPDARVRHVGAGTTSAHKEKMSVEFHRSQARFYRAYRGLAGYAILKAIVWAGIAYRLARSLRAYARGRIDGALLRERLDGYWRILWF
ncbi:MAG: glycosyltransferase family 2 protein [Chloroflexota bacterium]|nr:glycosyltransferase family 2 protein [Chloroflexota bacterium]